LIRNFSQDADFLKTFFKPAEKAEESRTFSLSFPKKGVFLLSRRQIRPFAKRRTKMPGRA